MIRKLIICAFILFSALVGDVSGDASAAVVRGTVRVPGMKAAPRGSLNPYPGRANALSKSAAPRHGAVTDAVVYVEGPIPAGAGAGSDSGASHAPRGGRLAQKSQAFSPRVLPIAVGARVDFPNLDPIYHNVFSVSPTKRFDLGKYGRGKSKSVVFEKAGLVNVYCELHSGMEGIILVLPSAWFAQPAPDGEFLLPPLPAGSYAIKAWHPDFGERSIPVVIAEGEERVLEIVY